MSNNDIGNFFNDLSDGPCWVSGKRMKELVALMAKDRARLMSGCGDEIATEKGRFFRVNGTGGAASATTAVVVKKIGGDWKAGVAKDVFLADEVVAGSTPSPITIDGKLTTQEDDDAGWKDTFENDYVWIEGEITSLVPGDTSVKSYGAGDDFEGGEIENDGDPDNPQQTKFRLVLAKIVSDGAGGLRVEPMAGKTHRLGTTYGDSKDVSGGNAATITALLPSAL